MNRSSLSPLVVPRGSIRNVEGKLDEVFKDASPLLPFPKKLDTHS